MMNENVEEFEPLFKTKIIPVNDLEIEKALKDVLESKPTNICVKPENMNFTQKEIKKLANYLITTVKKSKYRIRNIWGIEELTEKEVIIAVEKGKDVVIVWEINTDPHSGIGFFSETFRIFHP